MLCYPLSQSITRIGCCRFYCSIDYLFFFQVVCSFKKRKMRCVLDWNNRMTAFLQSHAMTLSNFKFSMLLTTPSSCKSFNCKRIVTRDRQIDRIFRCISTIMPTKSWGTWDTTCRELWKQQMPLLQASLPMLLIQTKLSICCHSRLCSCS